MSEKKVGKYERETDHSVNWKDMTAEFTGGHSHGIDRPHLGEGFAQLKPDNGGLRYNAGKNQLELIPVEWTWALGLVLTSGAIKYAIRNWERGMKWSYLIGCISRHVAKFMCGERYDAESGCHHMAHVAWNALALMSYDIREIGERDFGAGCVNWLEQCAIRPGPELLAKMAEENADG